MKINKIQILIPGGGFYGGLESLHQFVYMASSLGVKISCVYIPTQNIDLDIPSIPACLKLHDIDVIVRIRTLKDKNN